MTNTLSSQAVVPILQVHDLEKSFPILSPFLRRVTGQISAVRGVSFTVNRGEAIGIVGESGCGKSTLAECLVRLTRPTSGEILFQGRDVSSIEGAELRRYRRSVQVVAQDPFESLSPRMTVRQIISEPMVVHRIGTPASRAKRVVELCEATGIDVKLIDRRPATFSGGQRQRIAIARALAPGPELLVLDEPVSALDTSVQAQILNLLNDLRRDLGISYVFIGHDLGVVRQVCDRVGVMYLGKIVEIGNVHSVLDAPVHPYTGELMKAASALEAEQAADLMSIERLAGEVPSPKNPPSGCGFRTRCRFATEICAEVAPGFKAYGEDHLAATHHPLRLTPLAH